MSAWFVPLRDCLQGSVSDSNSILESDENFVFHVLKEISNTDVFSKVPPYKTTWVHSCRKYGLFSDWKAARIHVALGTHHIEINVNVDYFFQVLSLISHYHWTMKNSSLRKCNKGDLLHIWVKRLYIINASNAKFHLIDNRNRILDMAIESSV